MSASTTTSFSDFGVGWSAILTASGWWLLEPTLGPVEPVPYELPSGLWCVVTSDNPQGYPCPDSENSTRRQELVRDARASGLFFHTAGGEGGGGDPLRWAACERGVLVRVQDYSDAVHWCRKFDQAAVYLLEQGCRVLLDHAGTVVLRQNLKFHRISE